MILVEDAKNMKWIDFLCEQQSDDDLGEIQ